MLFCGAALLMGWMSTEVFISLLATFAVIVKGIADAYFSRTDRTQQDAKPTA
jgi:hypothetical protein